MVRWLILGHRYLGIALSALLVLWFASGIAMIYVRAMPSVSADERLTRLTPLAFDRVTLTPDQAAAPNGLRTDSDRQRLFMILDRPVYRFSGQEAVTVFADNGERVPPADDRTSLRIAAAFLSQDPDRLAFVERLTVADQWTLGQRRQMPLRKFAVDDGPKTEIYVSEPLAEVVMMTTRQSRMLAWLGPIPHWLYFAPLRRQDAVWRHVVLWTSAFGGLLAVLGLIVGIRQWRTPYSGWLKWHQTTGLIFGVFALTWVFSGWLSMEPAAWAGADRGLSSAIAKQLSLASDQSPPPADGDVSRLGRFGGSVKEVEWTRILGAQFCMVRSSTGPLLIDAVTLEIRAPSVFVGR